jgi:hypothetical protein
LISRQAGAQVTVNVQWQNIKPGYLSDTVSYAEARKLTWNDFRGRPDAASPAGAITQSGFGYGMSMHSANNKTIVNITIYCYFDKRKSWVKKGMTTNYALTHEQHHFDITFLNTSNFVKKLKEAVFDKTNCNSVIEKIYDECFSALNKMQNDYDGETSNGRIEIMQQNWNKKIDSQLAALITN